METQVAAQYASSTLVFRIEAGLTAMGLSEGPLDRQELAAIDEFHIGGRDATKLLCANLPPLSGLEILDIGCGIGGPARFFAANFGCMVTGIDLTKDYVDAGNKLCARTGLADKVTLIEASATNMPLSAESFDIAYMMHVGMNIEDKNALMSEAFRTLRPGGSLAIYDVMKIGTGQTVYPLPWADDAVTDAACAPKLYREALSNAGFILTSECDRSQLALNVFKRMAAANNKRQKPSPLGLHILMGPSTPQKVANIATQIERNEFAPIEMIAKKPQ